MTSSSTNSSDQIIQNNSSRTVQIKRIEKNIQSRENQEHLESELRLTLVEIARLHNALADANMKLIAYQNQLTQNNPPTKKIIDATIELSKEIYQPLATITNYCDLLLGQSVGVLGSLQQKFLERINSSANQIHQLLDQFLQNAPIDKMIQNDQQNLASIHEIVERVISTKSESLQEKQIILQLEVPDSLPEVMGNEEDLDRIVEIVISNALDITPPEKMVKISLTEENQSSEHRVILSVLDSGPGIPVEMIEKLFSVHAFANQSEILGLTISRTQLFALNNLIQDQGGFLKIEDSANSGLLVRISLIPSMKH